jgi:hypothetical protein
MASPRSPAPTLFSPPRHQQREWRAWRQLRSWIYGLSVCAWGQELTRPLYPGQNRRGDGERAIDRPFYPPTATGSQARKERSLARSGVVIRGRGYGQRPTAGTGTPQPKQESHVAANRGSAHAQLSGHGRLRAPRGQPALDEEEPGHLPPANERPEATHAVVMPAAGGPAADFIPGSGGRPEEAVVARFCSHGCSHASVAGWIVKALTAHGRLGNSAFPGARLFLAGLPPFAAAL